MNSLNFTKAVIPILQLVHRLGVEHSLYVSSILYGVTGMTTLCVLDHILWAWDANKPHQDVNLNIYF